MEINDNIVAVQRMQDYIIDHLKDDIVIEEVTAVSGYSHYHALKIFKELLGVSTAKYIRDLKLTKAALDLRDKQVKIVDLAYQNYYESHDGFSRAFFKRFKILPQSYKESTPPIPMLTYYPIKNYYRLIKEDYAMNTINFTITVSKIHKQARKMIILRSLSASDYFSYCEEVGCDWEGLLNSIKEKFDTAALITLPIRLTKEGTSRIAAGIEVPLDYGKQLPERYEMIDLEECDMLCFKSSTYDDEDAFCDAIDAVMEAVNNYDYSIYNCVKDEEVAPTFNFGASGASGAKFSVAIK